MAEQGSYELGKKVGDWKLFYEEGKPMQTLTFQKGTLFNVSDFLDKKSNVMPKGTFIKFSNSDKNKIKNKTGINIIESIIFTLKYIYFNLINFLNLNFTNFENELTNPYQLYKKFINNKYNGHQLYNFDWYSKTF